MDFNVVPNMIRNLTGKKNCHQGQSIVVDEFGTRVAKKIGNIFTTNIAQTSRFFGMRYVFDRPSIGNFGK